MSDDDDDSLSSSTAEQLNSKISLAIGKHIYFDDEHDDNENSTTPKIIERPVSSTIRVDSSDLISRCKDFIPLLANTDQNSIDNNNKDQTNENKNDDDLIVPETDDSSTEKDAKESGEASSTTDEEIVKKKRKKKKKKKKKKLKINDNTNEDVNVNNQDLVSE